MNVRRRTSLQTVTDQVAGLHSPALPSGQVLNLRQRSESPVVVVHAVGEVTDALYSFLRAASDLGSAGPQAQTIVMMDRAPGDTTERVFHPAVKVVRISRQGGPVLSWLRWMAAVRRELHQQEASAVHLHGYTPTLLAAAALRSSTEGLRWYYSPHGSRLLKGATPVQRWARTLLAPLLRSVRFHPVAHSSLDAQRVGRLTTQPIGLVENWVDPAYFQAETTESEHPLVVAGVHHDRRGCVERFTQLAILMAGLRSGLRFRWVDAVDTDSTVRLRAAGVAQAGASDALARAQAMSDAWIFIAPTDAHGSALHVQEAMAMGKTCVVIDTPQHRTLIKDGETGLLCATEDDLFISVGLLIDAPLLRQRIGAAARQAAQQRFSSAAFKASLQKVYQDESDLG